MTGPGHYREAERLLAMAALQFDTEVREAAQFNLAEAQVHATLALAAATAFAADMTAGEWPGWLAAAGSEQTKADASMTGPAATVSVLDTTGRDVHIGPHDIFRHDPNGPPVHLFTRDADVHIDGIDKTHRGIAVLMWHAGTVCGATVYDRDDRVRRTA